jgi:hypothetical protein
MSEIKLKFEEALKIADDIRQPASRLGMRGRIRLIDPVTGKVILEKDNLIVMRGRTYALESLFKDPIDPAASGYKVNLNRTVGLFKIGSGGADIQSAPFQPFTPLYSDEDMAVPVPFVTLDSGKYDSQEKENNPSIVEQMSENQKRKYYLPTQRQDGTSEYFGKVFEVEPQWVFNKSTNEVYKKIMLKIDANEARGYMINELGLVIAEYDATNNVWKDAELFSRVTFDTQSLTSLTRSLLVEYLIFA